MTFLQTGKVLSLNMTLTNKHIQIIVMIIHVQILIDNVIKLVLIFLYSADMSRKERCLYEVFFRRLQKKLVMELKK